MGFTRDITDRSGVNYPAAYYKVINCRYDWQRKIVAFNLSAWKDKDARTAGLATLTGVPAPLMFTCENVGEGTDFDDNFGTTVQDVEGNNLVKLCYAWAKTKIDDPNLVDDL